MVNKLRDMNLMNVIFFTITIVFLLLAVFSGSFTVPAALIGLAFIGLIYILFTRRFYIIIPLIAVYYMLVIMSTLPLTAYYMLGEDPSFIIASAPLGFFLTLWISNTIRFAELSIRSPWIANILGITLLYATELSLVYASDGMGQVLIGIIGFLSFMLISMVYLIFSPTAWVHNPSQPITEDTITKFTDNLVESNEYSYVDNKKGETDKLLLASNFSENKYLYKLSPIGDMLVYYKDNKKFKKFYFRTGVEEKRAYSWLYKRAVESYESRHAGKFTRQLPIIIEDVSNKKEFPDIEVIELPIPRSKKIYYVGKITLSENEDKNVEMFNKLTVMLEMKNEEE